MGHYICTETFGPAASVRTSNNPGVRVSRSYAGNYGSSPTPKGKSPGPWRDGYVLPRTKPPSTTGTSARATERGGTLQIGVHGFVASYGAAEAGMGLAISQTEIGGYTTPGVGFGPREDANISISVSWSNANSINNLNGAGMSGSVGGGAVGHLSAQAGKANVAPGEAPIYTGGFSIGLGAGLGASAMSTQTNVSVWSSYDD